MFDTFARDPYGVRTFHVVECAAKWPFEQLIKVSTVATPVPWLLPGDVLIACSQKAESLMSLTMRLSSSSTWIARHSIPI